MPVVPSAPDSEQFIRIGKVLSSPHRLVIMNILSQGEHSVESLAQHSGLSVANLSRHLQMLKSVYLVQVSRKENICTTGYAIDEPATSS